MRALVTYATKHGSTRGIAERIAGRLREAGLEVDLEAAGAVRDVAAYDAVVLGSALYMFHWLKDARSFARRYHTRLAGRPVWLFSSGPIGTETVDKQGRNVLEVAGPKEIEELRAMLAPRDHRVFFGAWDTSAKPIGLSERFLGLMPAARAAMPSGDFRDWPQIDAWADGIAAELSKRGSGPR